MQKRAGLSIVDLEEMAANSKYIFIQLPNTIRTTSNLNSTRMEKLSTNIIM